MYSFIWIVFLSWGTKKRVNCNTEDRWDKHVHVYIYGQNAQIFILHV